jgi:hypothetical protein
VVTYVPRLGVVFRLLTVVYTRTSSTRDVRSNMGGEGQRADGGDAGIIGQRWGGGGCNPCLHRNF